MLISGRLLTVWWKMSELPILHTRFAAGGTVNASELRYKHNDNMRRVLAEIHSHVHVCSPGRKRDPGFQQLQHSSRVLTPIWAARLRQIVTKNSRHGGWTGDAKPQTGVDAAQRQAGGGEGGCRRGGARRVGGLQPPDRTAPVPGRNSVYRDKETRYLFCKRPFIYRILTPGSNPLQKRRRTGNEPRPVHYGDCSL